MSTAYTFVSGADVYTVHADNEVDALNKADAHVRKVTGEDAFCWYDTDRPHVYVRGEDVYLGV